jgi:PAS domain S-box-containing protein
MIQQAAITQLIFQALQGLIKTDEALQATIDSIRSALAVGCCLLTKPTAQEQRQVYLTSQAAIKTACFTNTCFQTYFQSQLTQGNVVVCDRLDHISSPDVQQFIQTSGICAAVIAPLISQQSYLGEITLYQCDRQSPWAAAALELIQITADHLAIALYHTALHKRLEQAEKTEAALQESEERYKVLANAVPQLVWTMAPDASTEYCNQQWLEYSGLTAEQSLNSEKFELMHPDDVQQTLNCWNQATQTGKSFTTEYRLKRVKDGMYRWHLAQLSPLDDQDGNVVRWIGNATDIQERKQAEKALHQSEEQFRQFAENIGEVFWMTSTDYRQVLYISPAYEVIWGRSCQSLYKDPNSWFDSMHPEDRDRIAALVEEQTIQEWEIEYRIIRPDQTTRWIRDRAFPVRDESGEVYRIAGIAEDITLRKQTEQEAKLLQIMAHAIFESEDFYSALQVALQKVCEATTWAFGEAWIPKADRSMLECSPVWYSKAEGLARFRELSQKFVFPPGVGLPGRVWATKYPEWCRNVSTEASNIYLRTNLALEAGLKAALGIPIVANDNVLAVLVFYMFEAREEDQRLIELISASTELGLFIQRKQAEGEIRKSLLKEKELNRLKSDFISMVSHEFRTPLSSIVLSAELLENYGQRCSEEKKQTYFRRIQTSAQRITQLLENVLFLGQSESGRLGFSPKPINLERFCQELVEELDPGEGSQHSVVYVSQGNRENVCMDENLLQHIFVNLLSNAIKYSPQGGIIRFELLTQTKEAIFKVQDTGIGIPEREQPQVFEAFHRATNVDRIGGTGLGLSIVKHCVDLHGGQISLHSEIGVGTTFTVRLPISQPTES